YEAFDNFSKVVDTGEGTWSLSGATIQIAGSLPGLSNGVEGLVESTYVVDALELRPQVLTVQSLRYTIGEGPPRDSHRSHVTIGFDEDGAHAFNGDGLPIRVACARPDDFVGGPNRPRK